MPELPEVETVVRGLRAIVLHKKITGIEVLHTRPLINSNPRQFKQFLNDEEIEDIERRGKYLIFTFTSRKRMVVHLRMTGKFVYLPPPAQVPGETELQVAEQQPDYLKERTHIRFIFHLADHSTLLFQDVRIFGTFKIYPAGQPLDEESKLGLEPFSHELTPEWLVARLQKRTLALKAVLLDQKVITGLGNIYVCEALYAARINPFMPAKQLSPEQAAALIPCIRDVLKRALRYGGTTINDFSHIDEKSGRFQKMLKVYQHKGELCKQCGRGIIACQKLAQRSTYYCPVCQA